MADQPISPVPHLGGSDAVRERLLTEPVPLVEHLGFHTVNFNCQY